MLDITPILIQAKNISSAWCQLICAIHNYGTLHQPYPNTITKRIHATLAIEDVYQDQVSPHLIFRTKSLEEYKKELTKEYSDWYNSLSDDDPQKFVYCYADRLFSYGDTNYNTLLTNIINLSPGSRRHVGVLWNNLTDIHTSEDQPCWVAYKLELLPDNKILLYILYRSWDAFLGMPANLPAIVHGVTKVLHSVNPEYTISSLLCTGWDAHIYSTYQSEVTQLLSTNRLCDRCLQLKPSSTVRLQHDESICTDCLK